MANKLSKHYKGLNAFHIRLIATFAMVVSFISRTDILGKANNALADCMVWFSYTLFAYLLAQGLNHTSNRLLYLRRFIVFTALSEVAYDFYNKGTYWDPANQSIMVTLLIVFTVMLICDYFKRRFRNSILNIILIVTLSIVAINITGMVNSEFGKYGVLLAMLFYTSYDLTYPRLFELALIVYYAYMVETETIINITVNGLQYSVPIVIFALFALIVTWFYNKERGPNALALKIIYYLLYPLCLTGFYLLKILG